MTFLHILRSVSGHLFHVPVAELRGDLDPRHVFVHGEVEVRAASLQRHAVPVPVVQQAAEGREAPALGGRSPACNRTGERERERGVEKRVQRPTGPNKKALLLSS